jgi:hypothetical protein
MNTDTYNLLKLRVPSAFTETAHGDVSEKYQHISTEKVINVLDANGWKPHSAEQRRTLDVERKPYAAHMIRWFHPDFPEAGGIRPQLVTMNSHDRSNAFNFFLGALRFACFNGLIMGDSLVSFKVRHIGANALDVMEAINGAISYVPNMLSDVQRMRETELDQSQAISLALAAMSLRWPKGSPVEASQVLRRRRQDDSGRDLFTIYNVLQENILRGGQSYRGRTQWNRTRKITSLPQIVRINRNLWDVAKERIS